MEWVFWLEFSKAVQRRGTRENTPEIGSRVGEKCFGGIWGNHAELRRDLFWGNLIWVIFWVLAGDPREAVEEGGQLVYI
jgi:hypothetical protein